MLKTLKERLEPYLERKQELVLVSDRGIASYQMAVELHQEGLKFVMPLRKNFGIIDYLRSFEGAFRYQDRVIAWSERAVELHGRKMRLLLFWDTKLEGEQKQMWLDRYERGELSKQDVEERFVQCGKIALLTNTSFPAEEMYLLYKSRASIEECIRRFKDALNMEGTDMRDDQALAGYFFVLSLAMRCHYLLMQKLRDAKLLKHYSVQDAIWELRKIRKEPWIKGWHLRPLTRRQKTLIEKLGLSQLLGIN